MLIVAAVLAGSAVGWVLTRRLATQGYRRPDETGRPAPASRWWLIPATSTAWGWLVFTLAGCLIGFAILHIASPNALGFGDVKLAAILGAAIGVVSLTAVLAALLLACILALTWATATRTRHLAFGPWLAAGAILGVGLPGLSGALA